MGIPVKLPVFEGPLDLLLHLIEKNKVNIYDIPIVEITDQYMEYIHQMEREDLNIMSEFMVMAATLISIKCRMLLPKEVNEDGEEEDPRDELVRQLLEYKMYKYMSYELRDRMSEAAKSIYKLPSLPKEVEDYREPVDTGELLDGLTLGRLGTRMEIEHLEGAVEALLFAMGESVEVSAIAKAIGHDTETTRKIIRNMMLKYNAKDRGIKIIELENAYQMCTKEEYYDYLVKLALQPKKAVLTDVMLETLSIIAYKQPVTKLEIEKIRGVKSDHAVNKLMEYNLVQEVGRLDAPGRPLLFGTTEEFLRNFGVQGLDELPELDPVQIEDFKAEAEEEIQLKLDV